MQDKYKEISIVYGARTVADLVYKPELEEWSNRPDVRLVTTVDPGGETPDWKGEIGFVPTVLEKIAPSSQNTVAIVCGPPIMIKLTFPVLEKLGFTDENIYTTLENRMKCGFGKCGRCNVGGFAQRIAGRVAFDGLAFVAQCLGDLLKAPRPRRTRGPS